MSSIRLFRSALVPAAALAALAACSDGPTATLPPVDIDAVEAQVAQLESALAAPVLYSLFGSEESDIGFSVAPSLSAGSVDAASPLDGTRSNGTRIRSALGSAVSSATPAAASELASEFSIPVELWGRTYVKDNVNGGMMWDESRTDAPARGVRITLYQRTGLGTFGNTVVGSLDVIDSSTTALQVARFNVYDAQGQQVATFRATSAGDEATSLTSTFTGTFGVQPRTFSVADTMSVATSASTGSMTLRWRSVTKADFAGVEVATLASVSGVPGSNTGSGQVEIAVTIDGHTTRIVGSGTGAGISGGGRVYVDGRHVASIDAETGELVGPNGGAVAVEVEHYLGAVALAAIRMPNAMLIGFIIAMHIPYA